MQVVALNKRLYVNDVQKNQSHFRKWVELQRGQSYVNIFEDYVLKKLTITLFNYYFSWI